MIRQIAAEVKAEILRGLSGIYLSLLTGALVIGAAIILWDAYDQYKGL
jgi:hypothetical protein